jgi:predicted phosphodiesterase
MRTVTWLHLSDWHQRGPDFDRGVVRDALLKDLAQRSKIDRRLAEVDFLVFSGDLAFSGSGAEYETAGKEFLDPVLEVTNVPKDRLFLVPGNHDIARPTLKLLAPLLSVMQNEKLVNEYLLDADSREILFAPAKAYSRFIRKYLEKAAPEDPCFSYLRGFSVREIPIALVGMNSAWMCGQHEDVNPATGSKEVRDQGYLLLGEPQFSHPTRISAFKEAEVRVGVLHHPPDWFNKELSRWPVKTSLEQGFDFILHGHEHLNLIAGKRGPRGSCMVISGGASYDRRDYPNGYNFTHLDLDSGQGTLFFRRYDEGAGFHKDTITTGDETAGFYTFELPPRLCRPVSRQAAVPRAPQSSSSLSVELIQDASSEDVLSALELYSDRIPQDEQFQAPDIMRWLREDEEARAVSEGPRDFFFVAKRADHVCGFALLHYYWKQKLAFIAYMVAERGVGIDRGTISSRLLAEVARLFASGGILAQANGILLEVDDPRKAEDEEQRRERIARIRLFCTLAERERFTLRALDFDYRQPLLVVPTAADHGQEVPMLLMYAQRQAHGIDSALPRERVESLLDFIYRWLYPEGFSAIPAENEAYRTYLDGFYAAQIARLQERVPTLGLAQIGVRCGGS